MQYLVLKETNLEQSLNMDQSLLNQINKLKFCTSMEITLFMIMNQKHGEE